MPNYETINKLHNLIDNLQAWIEHEKQPGAYLATADTLEDMGERLVAIAANHKADE